MASLERSVRRLQLKAASDSHVRRVVLGLEDALRTASLPGVDGRLWVVRKLNLGRISVEVSPQALAILLEERVASQGLSAVHGIEPGAMTADAVWFRDSLEAYTALGLRLAAGKSTTEWYWPLAINGWRGNWNEKEGLRWLAFSLAARPEAAVALPHWAGVLVRARQSNVLIDGLCPGDGRALLTLCRGTGKMDESEGQESPTADDRLLWLRTMLKMAGLVDYTYRLDEPVRLNPTENKAALASNSQHQTEEASANASNAVTEEIQSMGQTIGASIYGSADTRLGDLPFLSPAADSDGQPRATNQLLTESGNPSNEPILMGPESSDTRGDLTAGLYRPEVRFQVLENTPTANQINSALSEDETINREEAEIIKAWAFEGMPTNAGGLLFLLPVLARLGFGGWVDGLSAEWERIDMVRLILSLVLERLRVCPDDPAWSITSCKIRGSVPNTFDAPQTWLGLCPDATRFFSTDQDDGGQLWDSTGRLLLAAWRGAVPIRVANLMEQNRVSPKPLAADKIPILELVAQAWLNACRRWLRRQARLGLPDLVMRTAQVSLTPTHIDIYFTLNATDLRVRRAGLDIDPGWLPWLGRVVMFHYINQPLSAGLDSAK